MKDMVVRACKVAPFHWIGIDTAKATFDAALVRAGQKYPATPLAAIPVKHFARTAAGVEAFVAWVDTLLNEHAQPADVRIVMEATGGYSVELAAWITALRPQWAPAIAPPRQTAPFIKSLGARNKTDKLEARALAFYGMERQPPAYQPLSKDEAILREQVRYRDFLVRHRVAEQNRADEMSHCPAAATMVRRRLAQIEKDIAKIELQIRKQLDKLSQAKDDVEQLCTIYGVGFVTAVTIRAELGDLRRFAKARQLTAYAGLNPSLRDSGTSVHGRPHMNKNGNPRVRQALYLSAMVAIRGNNNLRQTYLKLRQQGKSAMSAIGAVMRKLLVLMRAILISQKSFDPLWKTRCLDSQNATQNA